MTTIKESSKACFTCKQLCQKTTCDGCSQTYCHTHLNEHRLEVNQKLNYIRKDCSQLKDEFCQQNINRKLTEKIDRWQVDAINKIQEISRQARYNLANMIQDLNSKTLTAIDEISKFLRYADSQSFAENDLDYYQKQVEEIKVEYEKWSQADMYHDDTSLMLPIEFKTAEVTEKYVNGSSPKMALLRTESNISIAQTSDPVRKSPKPNNRSHSYPYFTFGVSESTNSKVNTLFVELSKLKPMEKKGPMSGSCDRETSQMENFLSRVFGFRNVPEQYIVQGVKDFRLDQPIEKFDSNRIICFPEPAINAFRMTVTEILDWQQSYKVYADKYVEGMSKEFLKRALQGKSRSGEEAFCMKFVVRISTCPILMEFDAKVIQRDVSDDWPNRIKMVSVTGIDFAARSHDYGDILYYLSNWQKIFHLDSKTGIPLSLNERDLCLKTNAPAAKLYERRVLDSLVRMARLRLNACDVEKVEVVVETGIGLGVFSGSELGIDAKIRALSAKAIRTVLEEDGQSYKHICAVIFAMPIFNQHESARSSGNNPFYDYANEFQRSNYSGSIPVFVADQDMHRLTVAIAQRGFVVSELNPADSHGVFGEYWQNRGPAVEEKLALTTVGLLTQHHLINPNVLDDNNYLLVELKDAKKLRWQEVVSVIL